MSHATQRILAFVLWLFLFAVAAGVIVFLSAMANAVNDNTSHAVSRAVFWCHDINVRRGDVDFMAICREWSNGFTRSEKATIAECDRNYPERDEAFKGCLIQRGISPPGT